MFVFNIKVHNNWLRRCGIVIVVALLIVIFFIIGCKLYGATAKFTVNDDVLYDDNGYVEINANNYTNVLKDAHENANKYVGKKVKFTGFVYRLYDFSENQFVLAREMLLNGNTNVQKAVVVGFLCKNVCKDVEMKNFVDRSWVEVEGTIVKGNYHGDRPIIEVENIREVSIPKDEFVYEPDGGFVSEEN